MVHPGYVDSVDRLKSFAQRFYSLDDLRDELAEGFDNLSDVDLLLLTGIAEGYYLRHDIAALIPSSPKAFRSHSARLARFDNDAPAFIVGNGSPEVGLRHRVKVQSAGSDLFERFGAALTTVLGVENEEQLSTYLNLVAFFLPANDNPSACGGDSGGGLRSEIGTSDIMGLHSQSIFFNESEDDIDWVNGCWNEPVHRGVLLEAKRPWLQCAAQAMRALPADDSHTLYLSDLCTDIADPVASRMGAYSRAPSGDSTPGFWSYDYNRHIGFPVRHNPDSALNPNLTVSISSLDLAEQKRADFSDISYVCADGSVGALTSMTCSGDAKACTCQNNVCATEASNIGITALKIGPRCEGADQSGWLFVRAKQNYLERNNAKSLNMFVSVNISAATNAN